MGSSWTAYITVLSKGCVVACHALHKGTHEEVIIGDFRLMLACLLGRLYWKKHPPPVVMHPPRGATLSNSHNDAVWTSDTLLSNLVKKELAQDNKCGFSVQN